MLKRDKGFAEQVTQKNTVYEVQCDYNLGDSTLFIPEGCTLVFNGGSLKNGALMGKGSFSSRSGSDVVQGAEGAKTVQLSGTWTLEIS